MRIVMATTTLCLSRSLTSRSFTMPDTLSVDLLFDQVRDAVRRQEARLSPPFSYDLSTTADFTGLPVHLLREHVPLRRTPGVQVLRPVAPSSRRFNRLLAPDVALRFRAARQYILIRNLRSSRPCSILTRRSPLYTCCCTIYVGPSYFVRAVPATMTPRAWSRHVPSGGLKMALLIRSNRGCLAAGAAHHPAWNEVAQEYRLA